MSSALNRFATHARPGIDFGHFKTGHLCLRLQLQHGAARSAIGGDLFCDVRLRCVLLLTCFGICYFWCGFFFCACTSICSFLASVLRYILELTFQIFRDDRLGHSDDPRTGSGSNSSLPARTTVDLSKRGLYDDDFVFLAAPRGARQRRAEEIGDRWQGTEIDVLGGELGGLTRTG